MSSCRSPIASKASKHRNTDHDFGCERQHTGCGLVQRQENQNHCTRADRDCREIAQNRPVRPCPRRECKQRSKRGDPSAALRDRKARRMGAAGEQQHQHAVHGAADQGGADHGRRLLADLKNRIDGEMDHAGRAKPRQQKRQEVREGPAILQRHDQLLDAWQGRPNAGAG